jgi:hypothetical protein
LKSCLENATKAQITKIGETFPTAFIIGMAGIQTNKPKQRIWEHLATQGQRGLWNLIPRGYFSENMLYFSEQMKHPVQ